MKKNEMFGWIAYAAMLALVLGIGFGVIQPMIQGANDADQVMNPILLLVLAVIASLILNAFLIEAGHLLGAAIGKYGVHSVNVLFFNFQKKKEGKGVSFSFRSYDGLTGETVLYPKDVEKSKPQAVVYMPLVLFFVEVLALVVWIVLCEVGRNSGNTGLVWWEIFAIAALTVGGMLYLYDIFPAPLDSKNDGYLLTVLTNETNRVAYNRLLLGNYQMLVGEKAEEMDVYDNVTDFTYGVNDIILYRRLAEGKLVDAAEIAEKAVRSQETLSGRLVHEASCQRVSLLLLAGEQEKASLAYKEMSIEDKKHASLLGSAPAVRITVKVAHNRRRLAKRPLPLFHKRRYAALYKLAGQLRHLGNRQHSVREQPPAVHREEPAEPIGEKHLQLVVRDVLAHEPPVHALTHERTRKMLQEQLGGHVLAVALPQKEVLAQMLGEGREEGAQGALIGTARAGLRDALDLVQ